MRTLIGLICLGIVASGCGMSEEDVAKISKATVKDGADSTYAPTSTINCVSDSTSPSYMYLWNIVKYSNGDKLVSCSFINAAIEVSTSTYYLSNTEGAESEACLLIYDIDDPSAGLWIFEVTDGVRSISYDDAESDMHGTTITPETSDCTEVLAD